MSGFSSSGLAEQLATSFESIWTKWLAGAPQDSHLWELSKGKMPLEVLEQDIIDIGAFFASADSLSQQAETYLLAEYITHLRQFFTQASSRRALEQSIEQQGQSLLHHPRRATHAHTAQDDIIYAPLSYRIAQLCAATALISPDMLGVLRRILLDIATHFLLHDGNITSQENQRLKEFHAALTNI